VHAQQDIGGGVRGGGGPPPAPPGFDALVGRLREVFAGLPDRRTGKNKSYSMLDAALGAFAVFFAQSPSFLASQKAMQKSRGQSNARTLFGMDRVPSDNHVRALIDVAPPEKLHPAFDALFDALRACGFLDGFHGFRGSRLVALDGTQTHHSEAVHCKNCTVREHSGGRTTYSHSALTPVLVRPGDSRAVPLRPEFVVPQDGHDKQDCEIAAAKRWLDRDAGRYREEGAPTTYLGDDLYAHEPFCRKVLGRGEHFLFTCLAASHRTLYAWLALLEEGRDVRTAVRRVKNKEQHWEEWTVRHAADLPLTDGGKALRVNWLELVVRDGKGRETYRNAWITDWALDDGAAFEAAASGRARWNIENGSNNTLKTKGYHLEHNFGHGELHLSNTLVAMNILAFLLHTCLDAADGAYRLVRAALPSRQTFFEHLRALTTYLCFPTWDALLDFMMQGLEIGPYEPPPKPPSPPRRRRTPRQAATGGLRPDGAPTA
jgi:hypothetical protein